MKAFGRGAAAMAASGALLLAPAACGGDGGDGGDPADELRKAAAKTAEENSSRSRPATRAAPTGTSPPTRPCPSDALDIKLKGEPDESNPTGEVRMLGSGDTTWIKGFSLAEGKSWLGIGKADVEEAGELGPTEDDIDYLSLPIEVLSTAEEIEKVGEEELGGVATTHCKGTLVTAELAEYEGVSLTAEERDDYLEDVSGGLKEFTVEVWVREDGLLAETREAGKGEKGEVESVAEFSDYGIR